jgi:chemosensory pili system protein ChpA (sensor histidine kinase/response regulator)
VLAHQRQSITSAAALLHHTRLTPADAINDRLHNVLWSTAKEIGKEADFEMAGGRIELDRVLLEKMIGPLEHILRNAVAHGIETADERLKRGKRQRGVVSVRVRQDAARVTITVEDDGAGIPVDVVRRKAVQRGLWPDQAPMSADQAAEMICTPGFSTAAVVSEHAGRGVGMDVVRSEILALGGRFQVTSTEGVGTIITLQLPASVAQASVLVVEAAGCSWALPIEMVDDVQASQDTLDGIAQEPLKVVPLAALVSPDRPAGAPRRRVVCRDRGRTMVLAVDRLVHVAAVPVHALGILWASQPGLAGTVVLPDGRALFLLDPFRLADAHHTLPSLGRIPSAAVDADQPGADQPGAVDRLDGSTPSHGSPGLSVTPSGRPMVLVVDDSLTVRKAAKRLLEANGYEITTAKDGQDALDLLRSIRPAVILMDIEMPRMNGLECVRVVRSTPALADLPIIMITSRTGDKHRSRALEMNVQAYLGKPFRDKEVLSALKSFAGTRVSAPTDP